MSVASACLIPESIGARVCGRVFSEGTHQIEVEHPTGCFTVELDLRENGTFARSALLRTARKLMQGQVFIPAGIWSN